MKLGIKVKFIVCTAMIAFNTMSHSQVIKGKVIDSLTKKPIELANITFVKKDLGVNSDKDGIFKIKVKDALDELQISSVGYNKKTLSLLPFNESKVYNIEIELSPKIEKLEGVIISNKKKNYSSIKTFGLIKKLKVRSGFPFGYEFCNYIKNPTHKKGKIKSIILSLNEKKEADFLATYNIKFYEYDSINKQPGEELYFENLIVAPQNKTYRLKIDVESLKIKLPQSGICVGVEIVNTKYNQEISSMSKIAPSINFTHTKMEILTWTRFRSKRWIVGTHKSQVKDAFVNAMINIEVQLEK
ncbi:carboxypeptidase-like regulatory domain-containing protein [Flavobacterium sandaracinum]|uniref:Carboxypeptidase-like regulatory domain-containing protein n=1 Tax=Flavobacterium sandaracinum TaxID=2541733 RepID=A0A4R5CJF2_9FLAO|nr:carboxypeptidase-like regulatory domain-containing protein [Flavobacterium sandaracinum]TDE00362.1 carboxypeptidase-like regulatory domain-containing protein [Flavobacterium sandaracinum]